MNKQEIMLKLNKCKFKAIKNSPSIFMYAGAAGVIVAGVMACKATLKLDEVTKEQREKIVEIKETRDDETVTDYNEKEARQDLAVMYSSMGLSIAKLYVPSVILGGLSLAAMIQSHNILNRRNAALAAALTTATETFNRYRKNVVERYGEEVDKEMRYGIKKEKVTVKDENGKNKKETIDVVVPMNTASEYARYFNESCGGWVEDPALNKMFLLSQQQYANDKLQAQGYLFLNDVYEMLGFEPSKAGQIVGWRYDLNNPTGDNYVDFGLHDVNIKTYRNDITNDTISEERMDFINEFVPCVLLDFNVDGNIWQTMGE